MKWLLITGIALIAGYLIYQHPIVREDNRKFDKLVWLQTADNQPYKPNVRYEMAKDLVDNYLKKGMSEKEVVSLLGPGERWVHTKSHLITLKYAQEMTARPFIRFCHIRIHFDSNSKLEKASRICEKGRRFEQNMQKI